MKVCHTTSRYIVNLQFVSFEIRAYDKAAITDGREAVTNFAPSIYGTDISLEAMDDGTGSFLYLLLGCERKTIC